MFHKNIPNNNKDIIRFLAKNFAGTKKVRNSILFCSVVIGIVAITMVFGISFGKIQAEEIRLIRENGAASSGRIEDGTEEQYAKLKQLDYIKQVGKSIFVGEATDISKNNEKTICNVVWADSESWNNFLRPAYTNVIGNYPQKKEEILLSERALKKLGISEPEQGMEINLDVYKGVFEHSKEKFELCGWYTDSGNELSIGYISHDKINELSLEKGPYTLLFSQSNHLSRNLIEGAYVTTVMSKKGIRPYDEGLSDLTNDNMVEGFSWDTVQILNDNQILSLKKYVQDNQLNIDVKSLEEGNGVLVIHDHMLTPEQQKLADEAIGEPVYFKTLLSREDAILRKEQSNSENKEKQQEEEFPQKESETFTLCGYLDRQSDNFPEIHQSWHGREGSIYYFISEKGFQKIPTEKKILAMELTADPEKEPYVKTQISELISEENKKRSEMTEVSMDEGTGEAGVFVICKSDLMQQKETYMRGNRILLGAISIILFIAGLTNYCNVVFTGMYARRKEFDIMKSIGMTDKQMKLMLFGEGSYYFMCVMGMLFTVGVAALVGVKIYMENKLSYFIFHWPIHVMVGVMFSLMLINVMVTHFICKKR